MIWLGEVTGPRATLWQKHSRPSLLRASFGSGGKKPREAPAEQWVWERGRAGSLHWEAARRGRGRGLVQPARAPSGLERGGSAAPWRPRSGSAGLCPLVQGPVTSPPSREAALLSRWSRRLGPHRRPRPFSCLSGSRDQILPACRDLRSMRPAGLECPHMLCLRPLLRLLLLLLLLPQPVTRAQTRPGAPSAPTALDTPTALGTPSALPTPGTSSAKTRPGSPSDSTAPSTPSAPTSPGTPSTPNLRERAQALMRDFPLVDGCVGAVGAELTPGLGRGS